jgi:very-short-patch-repair endonuclease
VSVRASLPLDRQCQLSGLPVPVAEFRFHPTRKWRFDWAFAARSVAVEVEGGAFTQGRHTRGAGFEKDLEKYAEAAILGWAILRVTPRMVADGRALGYVARLLER